MSLLNIEAFQLERVLDFDPLFLESDPDSHQHDTSVVSCSAKFEGELNVHKLQEWVSTLVQDLGANLYRCVAHRS
jgi:G3E family GTPase